MVDSDIALTISGLIAGLLFSTMVLKLYYMCKEVEDKNSYNKIRGEGYPLDKISNLELFIYKNSYAILALLIILSSTILYLSYNAVLLYRSGSIDLLKFVIENKVAVSIGTSFVLLIIAVIIDAFRQVKIKIAK